MNQAVQVRRSSARVYSNGVMTVIAVLLAILVLQQTMGLPSASEANAQRAKTPAELGGPLDAGAQRLRMITALEDMNGRLERIESAINSGISVKVTEMPEMASGLPKPFGE